MKIVLNIIVIALIVFLCYGLYSSIEQPIKFKTEFDRRQDAVVNKLKKVRQAQEYYKAINGHYSKSFDELVRSLRMDSFPKVKVYENPEKEEEFLYDTTFVSAKDSLKDWDINLDSIAFVPYSDNVKFDLYADTTTYQSTLTDVIEVGVQYKDFMGRFADESFRKYDKNYDPENKLKFGDRNKPNITGNWE